MDEREQAIERVMAVNVCRRSHSHSLTERGFICGIEDDLAKAVLKELIAAERRALTAVGCTGAKWTGELCATSDEQPCDRCRLLAELDAKEVTA